MSNDQVTMIAVLKLIACLAFPMAATGVKKGVQSTRGLVPLMWHAALCGTCMWLARALKKTLHHLRKNDNKKTLEKLFSSLRWVFLYVKLVRVGSNVCECGEKTKLSILEDGCHHTVA